MSTIYAILKLRTDYGVERAIVPHDEVEFTSHPFFEDQGAVINTKSLEYDFDGPLDSNMFRYNECELCVEIDGMLVSFGEWTR